MSSAVERSKKPRVENGIEGLTDTLLHEILSKLSLVEAARTSVLSHRWQDLWKFGTCLNFDASTVLSREVADESEAWYVAWVNKVTNSVGDKEFYVKDFRVHFWLGWRYEDDLTKWMCFAVAKQVETLHLNLSGYEPVVYKLKQACKLTEVECGRALFGLVNLTRLTTLRLTCVNVSNQLMRSILSSCLLLQHLSIGYTENMYDLTVSSSRLRYLEIVGCADNVLYEIHAPKLEKFVYFGEVFHPHIVDLPKLVSLDICVTDEPLQIWDILRPFLTQLPLLQYLYLGVNEVHMLNLEHIPKSLNLNSLSIRVGSYNENSCRTFIHLLKACPSLEKLQIDFARDPPDDPNELDLQGGAKCHPLECLKELELIVFHGDVFDWSFTKDLIGKSPHLEKVFINTSILNGIIGSTPDAYEIINTVRKKAITLQSQLPIGTRLIFC